MPDESGKKRLFKKGVLDRKRALKLRFRRRLRLRRRQVEEMGAQAEQRLEDDFFKRLERLAIVRRFVASWLLLIVLLIGVVVAQSRSLSGYYQVLAAAPGGTYVEGVLGSFTNANPMYATGVVDKSVSTLIFASLFTYDQNNQLIGDLAEGWSVDATGKQYTVKLKPNITWHDGQKLTANDVAFTYHTIQNPDARSPLVGSWSGIDVKAVDDQTITFALPSTLASFPYSMTNGIVPEHILGSVAMSDMRSVSFNSTQPIGAGPFKWQALELSGSSTDTRQEKIALQPFEHYHAGKPKLNGFVIRSFRDADQLIRSFQDQEVSGMVGLNQIPEVLKGDGVVRVYSVPLTAGVMTFFRTQHGIFTSAKVRQSLVAATDIQAIINNLGYPAMSVREPLLRGQLAYDPKFKQPGFDKAAAIRMLEEEGWKLSADGIRTRDGAPLKFNMHFLDNPEYKAVAERLKTQWHEVGADVELVADSEADFRTLVSPKDQDFEYDVLLYGISIGVDPDVYAYWHNSQNDLQSATRLNFSEYKSAQADQSLEAGRTRLDPALRSAKYQPFLQAWQADAPAVGLYQPRFLYITHGQVHGLAETLINTDDDRFRNVHNWQIREEWVKPINP
jgi:peptide/nickel transport system substrate-binding protein